MHVLRRSVETAGQSCPLMEYFECPFLREILVGKCDES